MVKGDTQATQALKQQSIACEEMMQVVSAAVYKVYKVADTADDLDESSVPQMQMRDTAVGLIAEVKQLLRLEAWISLLMIKYEPCDRSASSFVATAYMCISGSKRGEYWCYQHC